MPIVVDDVVEDGNVLVRTMSKYSAELPEDGVSSDAVQTGINELQRLDKGQKNAVQLVTETTAAQNVAVDRGFDAIRKVQKAAKGVFGEEDSVMMKKFHVGGVKLNTVKAVVRELGYMKGVAEELKDQLKKGGLKEADIAALETCATEVFEADGKQEQAKKLQANATAARDAALKSLKRMVSKVRNTAAVTFEKRPDVLKEFEPIPKGRGGNGDEPPGGTPPPQPPPEPPKQ